MQDINKNSTMKYQTVKKAEKQMKILLFCSFLSQYRRLTKKLNLDFKLISEANILNFLLSTRNLMEACSKIKL